MCGFHATEEHGGHWKTCEECRKEFETEMYVYYATNEYNFDPLENPPTFAPKFCSKCHKRIRLGTDAHLRKPGGALLCGNCMPPL